MDILILYTSYSNKERKNMVDHLYSFKRYAKGHHFYYLNIQRPGDLKRGILKRPFGGVIFHYSLLARRYDQNAWGPLYEGLRRRLAQLQGYKVAFTQDDYHYTANLWQLFGEAGVRHIFSVSGRQDFETIFPPDKTGGATVSPVLTGYIDPASLRTIAKLQKKVAARDIDIGYRARKIPYYCGRFGLLKYEIARRFEQALRGRGDVAANLSNTGNTAGTFMGDDWWRFLLRCRTMPGCLGGSDLFDPDGGIKRRGDAYLLEHPDADYDEIEAACFPGQDGRIHVHALSPRHFECAMTKTCQILVEGDYHGVFEAGVHYIEMKQDFSNLDDVLRQMMDVDHCERMAQRCFEDVVGSAGADNPNTYIWFANHVVDFMVQHAPAQVAAMGPLARFACRVSCFASRLRARVKLAVQGRVIGCYNAVSRWAKKHPATHARLKRVFGKDFEPLSS